MHTRPKILDTPHGQVVYFCNRPGRFDVLRAVEGQWQIAGFVYEVPPGRYSPIADTRLREAASLADGIEQVTGRLADLDARDALPRAARVIPERMPPLFGQRLERGRGDLPRRWKRPWPEPTMEP